MREKLRKFLKLTLVKTSTHILEYRKARNLCTSGDLNDFRGERSRVSVIKSDINELMEKMDNASKSIFESYDRESNIQLEVSKDRNPGNFTRLAKFPIDEKSKIQGKIKPNLKIEEKQ